LEAFWIETKGHLSSKGIQIHKTTPRALKLPIYEVFIILKDVTMTWQIWGSIQALEKRKTSLSLMEVFNIALK
jgi:hypothetical protein